MPELRSLRSMYLASGFMVCLLAFANPGCTSDGTTEVEETSPPATGGGGGCDEISAPERSSPQVEAGRLTGFHRSGQTFLTWTENGGVSGESYRVYRSSTQISGGQLEGATVIATVPESSGYFYNEAGNGYQTRFVLTDYGEELPEGVGLHVHTTRETGPFAAWYAVTEVRNGVEQPLQNSLTIEASITESRAFPCPVAVYTNGLKTLYTHWMDYSIWNPRFEGYAYNFWVGVPSGGNSSPLPLQLHLHAYGESWMRNWTVGDAYGSGTPFNLPAVWLEPDDNRNTWWYGFANDKSRGEQPDSGSIIVNYTEQRLLYYLQWITGPGSPYQIDANRIYLYGGSMGGSGTLSFGLRHPEWFSGLYALVGMTDEASSTWGRDGLENLWGPLELNLPTSDGPGVHDRLDTQQYLLDHRGEDLPYTVTFHGRLDTTIEWETQGLPWVLRRFEALAPGPEMWANSDHSNSYDVYLEDDFLNYPLSGFTLRRAESYLVFSQAPGDDDPNGSIPECRGWDPYAHGYLGNSVVWASSAYPFMGYGPPVDTSTHFETAVRIRTDLCNWPSSGTVTVTLRRLQAFRPAQGEVVAWEIQRSDGGVIQSGTASRDGYGRLTLSGVQVSTAGSILSLSRTSGGGQSIDADQDGVAVDEGDCNDGDGAVYPGAVEVCDARDNDCDLAIDEGVAIPFYRDTDEDGVGGAVTVTSCVAPDGYLELGGDCDDARADVHPGAPESCDGVDNDCDGVIDDGLGYRLYYEDHDSDGYGTAASSLDACVAPTGYVDRSGDCNDTDGTVHPAALEQRCDGQDNDCDGDVDET